MGCARVATRDTEIDGFAVSEGEQVMALLGAANVDEAEFADAGAITGIVRSTGIWPSVAASTAAWARTLPASELRVALREWHRRIPDYHIKPGIELNYTAGIRTLDAFPMVLGPRVSRRTTSIDGDRARAVAPPCVGRAPGRNVAVAAAEPATRRGPTGRRSSSTRPPRKAHQIEMLCVQASLLAAGSLGPDVVAATRAASDSSRGATSRSRAIGPRRERRRAAARWSGALVDRDLAAGSTAPRLARSRAKSTAHRRRASGVRHDPPAARARGRDAFGNRTRAAATRSATTRHAGRRRTPRTTRTTMTASDTCCRARSVVGEQSAGFSAGSCRRCRKRGGGGPPGADAPTHVTGGRAGYGRHVHVYNPPPCPRRRRRWHRGTARCIRSGTSTVAVIGRTGAR